MVVADVPVPDLVVDCKWTAPQRRSLRGAALGESRKEPWSRAMLDLGTDRTTDNGGDGKFEMSGLLVDERE